MNTYIHKLMRVEFNMSNIQDSGHRFRGNWMALRCIINVYNVYNHF